MTRKEIINSAKAPEPIGPYSQAIQANGFLFVSGQIAIRRETNELIIANIEEETEQVMRNLECVLRQANLSFDRVVKCSIFLKDMKQFSIVNAIYGKYFTSDFPARETVQVSELPKGVNVEISCIAAL